jgi:hypothetical protein
MDVGGLNTIMNNFFNILRGIAVAIATVFFALGALKYATANGNPRAMEEGKTGMINALAGMALIFAAGIIASLIRSAIPS